MANVGSLGLDWKEASISRRNSKIHYFDEALTFSPALQADISLTLPNNTRRQLFRVIYQTFICSSFSP